MFVPSRRAFLGTSLAGLACGLIRADGIVDIIKTADDPPFHPDTLFLTWQRDPTTTMTVQWIGARGETADTTITPTHTSSITVSPMLSHPRTDSPALIMLRNLPVIS